MEGQSGCAGVFCSNEATAPLQTFLQIRPGLLINIHTYNKEKPETIKACSNLSVCQRRGDAPASLRGRHRGTARGCMDSEGTQRNSSMSQVSMGLTANIKGF